MAKRILVVEDESIVAADLQKKVERLGHVVCGVAFSGEEAILKAEETTPDLVLMDVRLQGKMTGFEAASQIRRRRGRIPVVYVTAHAGLLRETAHNDEKFVCVSKPFSLNQVAAALDAALSSS